MVRSKKPCLDKGTSKSAMVSVTECFRAKSISEQITGLGSKHLFCQFNGHQAPERNLPLHMIKPNL